MAKATQKKLKDTLSSFLFNQIKNDPKYMAWEKEFVLPNFITDNLAKPLRDYQIEAVKHFIYLHEEIDASQAKHVLFNMATGTGKTLTMAAIILYLHEYGYRHFVFLVHQTQILEQAKKNFTDSSFAKYLFNKSVKFHGKKVNIKAVEQFNHHSSQDIQFMFLSTALLYNRLTVEKENRICADDFKRHKTVIIADEAHRLNVNTRKKLSKTEQKEINNWETAVQSAIYSSPNNLLLEFTATVDLKNEAIHQKYSDKLVYKYDFLQFNQAGYSKNVAFLYNDETQIEDQKRLLIVNAVALSEYRRLFAERAMGITINPIVLIKSTKIEQSKIDREFFHKIINTLRVDDFNHLQRMAKQKNDLFHDEFNFLSQLFSWLDSKQSGFIGLMGFITSIKERFSEHNSIIYNSKDKKGAELLSLDSPTNRIRTIFSVNALNEGWDVLSLYDIIHFDISATKKVSLQDIQLIGRGARLCPYDLPKEYQAIENINSSSKFKRKFDQAPDEYGRILETFFYHFVKTGVFLEQLKTDLLGEGIINEGVEKRTIHLKSTFMESQTYKQGFILVNYQQYRSKNKSSEINLAFKREIIANSYQLHAQSLTDNQQNQALAKVKYKKIKINDDYFSVHILRKALIIAENNFFRLNHLKQHIIGIASLDEMIDTYLPMYDIKYGYIDGKDIHELSAEEKLNLLVNSILPEVRKAIDRYMPIVTGSPVFRPKPLSSIFKQSKNIYLVAYPSINEETGERTLISHDERAIAQSQHNNPELQYDVKTADWYAYSENYGTSEEKRFVKYIATQIDELKSIYPNAEIYLIRNELDYYLFNVEDGRRFSPDYLLIINDFVNKQWYYQCLFEPKGGHLLDKDEWKEQALINLNEDVQICFNATTYDSDEYQQYLRELKTHDYQEIKCLGFKFFNSEPRGTSDFAMDFQERLYQDSH